MFSLRSPSPHWVCLRWQARKNEGVIVGTPNKECKNGPPSHTARELLAKSIVCGCNFPLSNGKINDQRVLRLTNGRLTVIYCWGRAPTAAVFVLRRLTLFWCRQFHIHITATRGSITKTRGCQADMTGCSPTTLSVQTGGAEKTGDSRDMTAPPSEDESAS